MTRFRLADTALPRRRRGRVMSAAALAGAGAATLAFARSTEWFRAFGGRSEGERLVRVRASPQWKDGRFRNTVPTVTVPPGRILETLRLQLAAGEARYPSRPIPVVRPAPAGLASTPSSGLRVTWLGHATALVDLDGARVLTDPVWSDRVSPSEWVGPRRFFAPPVALADLPKLEAVVISHDHYDHLDMPTIVTLASRATDEARFFVPMGVGAHLEKWGVPSSRIEELDWEESRAAGPLTLTLTPARHFSGRGLSDRDATLWGSWVLAGPTRRVYYSGDSGYFDGFREIGAAHGPFDATLMSLASYGPTWPDVHMTPEELVRAHVELRGEALVPVHWATFNLAFHDWNEPAIRAAAAAREQGVRLLLPRPGEMLEPGALPAEREAWWREP
jgi:L-ascorbate metabolism protein UlaG (beta-lactamase superfamily)